MAPSDEREEGTSFAALFEAEAKPGRTASARVGARMEATVVEVTAQSVFVELGGKQQGYFEADDLRDENGELTVKVGDRVRGQVLAIDAPTFNEVLSENADVLALFERAASLRAADARERIEETTRIFTGV